MQHRLEPRDRRRPWVPDRAGPQILEVGAKMSDELRQAAERLADRDLGDYQGPTGDDTDMRAGIMLARAYLREHDHEPVTEEWLESVGMGMEVQSRSLVLDDGENSVLIQPLKTRGDVRRLCKAIGIETP